MSTPVEMADLAERIAGCGPVAYLVTVRPEGRPHVVSAEVRLEDGELVLGAGRRSSANVAAQPDVTVVWAAAPGQGYCLIVDGTARSLAAPGEEPSLRIQPTGAVLHRTPEGDPSAPSCITVLPRL